MTIRNLGHSSSRSHASIRRLSAIGGLACMLLLPMAVQPAAAQTAASNPNHGVVVVPKDLDEWSGPARITSNLSALELSIQNRGAAPVLLAYNRISLRGSDGQVFRALPLFHVQRSAAGTAELKDPIDVRNLQYETTGFKLAPVYRKAYPKLPVAAEPVGLDPAYYELYSYYTGKPMPTTGMRRRGLPEGIIEPGGQVKGYLFFEEVPRSAKPVSLHYDLVSPGSGQHIATISIPVED